MLRTKISYGTEHAFEFSGGIDRKFLQKFCRFNLIVYPITVLSTDSLHMVQVRKPFVTSIHIW